MVKYRYAVLDIETTSLNRFEGKINYIGIGLSEDIGADIGKTYILNMFNDRDLDKFLRIVEQLRKKKVKLIWQNGKFDTLWLDLHYGVMLPIHYDVMLLGTAYDLAAPHALDDMALNYLGIPSWDIPLKEKIKPNSPKVEKYLEKDLSVPWELFGFFYNELSDKQWMHYNLLLKKAYLMYRKGEKKGIYFDTDKSLVVRKEYYKKQEEKLGELNKHYKINWNSPQQVSDVLFKKEGLPVIKRSEKTGAPSGDAKSLRRLVAQGYDLPTKLLEYKFYYGANTKFLNKWGNFAKHDHRIHPSFNITNVATGRTSCSDPNLQQVPRNKELRTLFTAAPGRVLIEADYSQIELRVAAHIAKDKTMIDIYKNDGDIHTKTAILTSGKAEPTKEDRSKAKAVNFGFLYGMLEGGFVDYAFDSYGVVFTLDEAREFRRLFFEGYSDLLPWHKEMEIICESMGGVENLFGRFRRLDDIYSRNRWERNSAIRKAINTPVQSTASDLLLFSAVEIDHKLSKEMDLYIPATIHDAILVDVPEEYADEACTEIQRIMAHPEALDIFGVEFSLPIKADIGIGAWGAK
jgi:DNA polymerase-1